MAQLKSRDKSLIKWILNIIIPMLVLLIPTDGNFTWTIKAFLIVTIFAIVLIATDNLPMLVIALGLPVCYIIFLKVPSAVVMRPWTTEIPWLILGGFLITQALQRTGLLKRMAYRCILLFGGRFRGIIYGMMFVGVIASLIISDLSAKVILLGALALGICEALGVKKGGRTASAIGLAALAATLGPSYLFLTGSTGNLVPLGIAASVGVTLPTWTQYLTHMFIPQLIYVFLTVLLIDILFKPDEEIRSKEYFKSQLASFGKISRDEIKIITISLILIVLVATSSIHQISVGWLFVCAAVVMMLPGIKVIGQEDMKNVNFTYILFVAACLSIGMVSVELGVGKTISEVIYPLIAGSASRVMGGVWGMGFLINFALTPLAAYSAFTAPLVDMANTIGVNPLPVLYSFIQGLEQVAFPYEYAPVLILFSYGMVSFKNIVKYNIIRAIISLVCMFLLFIPYWKLIGLL